MATKDVLNGYVDVRGRRYTLQEGITAKAITKLDVVALWAEHIMQTSA
jgi:hypothetical protein